MCIFDRNIRNVVMSIQQEVIYVIISGNVQYVHWPRLFAYVLSADTRASAHTIVSMIRAIAICGLFNMIPQ